MTDGEDTLFQNKAKNRDKQLMDENREDTFQICDLKATPGDIPGSDIKQMINKDAR